MISPFYIIICVLAIISPINAYNREIILKNIPIENEIVIIGFGIQIIFTLLVLLTKKEIIPSK